MPELPEVESTARYLRERIKGDTIVAVSVHWPRTIATHTAAKFAKLLIDRKIVDVSRRGKFLVFKLAPGPEILYAHLRMSGSFDVLKSGFARDKHDRVVLRLQSEREIRFNDPRKFARMYISANPDTVTGKLGIEPFDSDFTPDRLQQLLTQRRGRVKSLLLRQDLIAGLGNIYADEALWYAQVHPLRSASSLKKSEIALLHQGILEILSEAIQKAGTDFGDGVVDAGGYEPRVYGRAGEKCARCGREIRRIVVAQRGTHICIRCQRAPKI